MSCATALIGLSNSVFDMTLLQYMLKTYASYRCENLQIRGTNSYLLLQHSYHSHSILCIWIKYLTNIAVSLTASKHCIDKRKIFILHTTVPFLGFRSRHILDMTQNLHKEKANKHAVICSYLYHIDSKVFDCQHNVHIESCNCQTTNEWHFNLLILYFNKNDVRFVSTCSCLCEDHVLLTMCVFVCVRIMSYLLCVCLFV